MTRQNKEIAQRIMTLREDNGLSPEEMARKLDMATEDYVVLESGETDLPISLLETISQLFGIQFSILITGSEPKLRVYSVTRKGEGTHINRKSEYSYEALASNFQGKSMIPFEVTVPVSGDVPVATNGHEGQEFDYVLQGSINIIIDDTVITLNEGDSIYFDSTHKHGMTAIGSTALLLVMVDA
ncbi:MAG: cupin domain-containing protein [Abditibacteriota bacterium]|nr:cupin domain-containing protein [Abditibacteriota bacterium]